ncbi:DUF6243 family protein [Nocardiopsis algeriensis]|uniref:Uncharacterized protein n=1 Tax=Nocardiopsis algeriensis TaxID=1478215 RepID=A0A841ITP8_9ACTN|nr:DUF6243 family protein [Nocardiopsis algeriensis]MBB6121684.1 hypothetical protein [Nocardiopsis algeriensis]
MARNSDNLLGLGGQRGTFSRSALRGGKGSVPGGPSADARQSKQELLRKIKEKSQAQEAGENTAE